MCAATDALRVNQSDKRKGDWYEHTQPRSNDAIAVSYRECTGEEVAVAAVSIGCALRLAPGVSAREHPDHHKQGEARPAVGATRYLPPVYQVVAQAATSFAIGETVAP